MTSDRPLRFCMITTFYPPWNFGGDGVYVHRLSNELAGRGHSVDVIHCVDSYHSLSRRDPKMRHNDHPNVRVHGLESRLGFISPLATQQTGRPWFKGSRIREILQSGFDVIHYHNISLIGGPKILEYGSAIKLYTMHEYWLVCPTHVLFRFNSAACIRPHCFTCGLKYKRPPQWWRHFGTMRSGVKHVDAFIAPSRFSKETHERRGLRAPIVHLPHFIPVPAEKTPTITNRNLILPKGRPYFLFVGRLEKIKGVQTIIPAFLRYEKAQLWIAGAGTYESELRRLAGGSDNICFLGRRTEDELKALYRDATALIIPSLSYEVFPLVILEAFMQRTPVIVRNIGGMPEIVQESGGGLIYDTDEELKAKLQRLSRDVSYRDQLGASGRKTLDQKWTAEAHLKSYFSLIWQIAGARRIAPPSAEP